MFVKATALREMECKGDEAKDLVDNATRLFTDFTGDIYVADRELTEEDFDSMVMFWSR